VKPITIIGGGLAGLTLGILLRRESIPVALIEAGKYPRHRVCGEFLSGRGREILRSLELEQHLSGAVEARSCSFHVQNRKPIKFLLAQPALCVSRFTLDAHLAEEFQRRGGILKTSERANSDLSEPGIVRATGRRRSRYPRARMFGLKAHALQIQPTADLELHFAEGNYVGICKLGDDRSNVCGLFSSTGPVQSIHDRWKEIFASSVFSKTLNGAAWDESSFSTVAGLTWDREERDGNFSIGDAAAMIPPLTGNGMSMAIESAFEAVSSLRKYSAGEISWADCLRAHAASWRKTFNSRLRWAAFVQRMVFRSSGQSILYLGARLFPALPNLFFARTR
jgi:2-polyprenyl-6-methoxyphenol hydroxylase-like FAD-dependent oxidoreductase